jgi:hypothetical protein
MNNNYIIVLKSQLGPKSGTLKIRESRGERLWGILDLLGHKSLLVGKISNEGKDIELKGRIMTPLGLSTCMLSATKEENELTGEFKVENKFYEISGKR